MKLGFPNNPRHDVVQEIQWIAASGFDFVDLCLEPDRAAVENIDPAAIRRALQDSHLDVVGHTAWYLPIGSQMTALRQTAVAVAGDYLRAFAIIGARAVTIHSHWPSSLFTDREGLDWQVESLNQIVRVAQAHGIRILYEPIGSRRDTPANLETVLAACPDLGCHLDIGHCNLNGLDPVTMIRRFADRLSHLHLHDNDGNSDLHLPPGTGVINWPAVHAALKAIHYPGTVTLEVFSKDRDFALLARKKILQAWAT
jgi:sugar phosphate isomerase/epimerase